MRCIGCKGHVPYDAYTCPTCGLTQVSGQGLDEYEELEQEYRLEKAALAEGDAAKDVITDDHITDIFDRVVAAFIDVALMFGVFIGLVYVNGHEIADLERDPSGRIFTQAYIETFGVILLYWTLLHASPWHATIGKKVMSIKVVTIYGEGIGFSRSLLREICKWTISAGISFAGWIMAGFDDMGQTLHDKICGTYVVDDVD